MNKPTLAEIREKLCDLIYENRMIQKDAEKLDHLHRNLNLLLDRLDSTADPEELLKWYEIEKSKGRVYE